MIGSLRGICTLRNDVPESDNVPERE